MRNEDGIKETIKKKLKSIVTTISPKITAEILFYLAFHRRLDLKNPKTLDEKICRMKIGYYEQNPLIHQCADKYRVREYVESKGLGFILNDLIGVYDSVLDIPWDSLPDQFVLKCNHGCHYNIICSDKSRLDRNDVEKKLKKWMKEDYWRLNAELNYKGIEKKIICEAYLKGSDGKPVEDYKLYCFHGKPFAIIVCLDRYKDDTKFYFFDRDWNLLRINPDGKNAPEGFTLPKPECLDELFQYAVILSEPFPFVRVDLYAIDKRVVFGELTFSPASGMDKKRLPETDRMLGEMLNVPE